MLRSLAVTTLLLAAARPAAAQNPTPLPDAPGVALERPWRGDLGAALAGDLSAKSCRVDAGVLHCTCVQDGAWSVNEVAGDELHGLKDRSKQIFVGRLADDVAFDVVFFLDGVNLEIAELRRVDDAVIATGLVWRDGRALSQGCGVLEGAGAVVARAREARYDGSWEVSGFRGGPLPTPFARDVQRSAPGLLPPIFRATPERVEVEAIGHLGLNLLAVAAGGHQAPWSAGLGYVSFDEDRVTPLRATVTAADGEVGVAAYGRLAIGGRAHVRATVEHPMTDGMWALRRREAGAFFRDYRATRVGVSASGPAHGFQLSGEVLTLPDLPEELWIGELRYGTVFTTGPADWTVDLEQVSDRFDVTRHSVLFGLGVSGVIGRANAFWLRPSLDLLANFGAVTVARGFDASTSLNALAQVEAGVALEGRVDRVRHRVVPIVRAGADLYGIQQRQLREGVAEYPYTAPTGWRYAGVFVEHTLDLGAIAFETPIAAIVDVLRERDPTAFAVARLDARMGRARVSAAAVCTAGCEAVAMSVGGALRLGRWHAAYRVSDMAAAEIERTYADILFHRGFTAVRLIQTSAQPEVGVGHFARLGFDGRQLRAGAGWFLADEANGVEADVAWFFPGAGWGVGAGAGYAPSRGDWAANLGLVLR